VWGLKLELSKGSNTTKTIESCDLLRFHIAILFIL